MKIKTAAVLLLGMAAWPPLSAGAQESRDAANQPLPAWEQLTPARRNELIAPLRERWNANPDERAHMLERARRWHAMPPEQRRRAHRGMRRWEHMDPVKRAQMRILFERTRNLPREQRREAMVLFRAMLPMSPEEREQLRQRWQRMTPEEREAWMREHAPRRKVRIRRHDGDAQRD